MGWQTGQRGLIKILIKLIREKRERDKKKNKNRYHGQWWFYVIIGIWPDDVLIENLFAVCNAGGMQWCACECAEMG
jgi:hypothetical protein